MVDFNGNAGKNFGLSRNSIGMFVHQIRTSSCNLSTLMSIEKKPVELKIGFHDYEVIVKEVPSSRDQKIGTILHFKNISTQKKIEAELEDISRMKTNLLAIMSHDILGNLSAVLVMIENLKRIKHREACPDSLATLENMGYCANNCALFIDQLLLWSKSQFGVLRPCFIEVDVNLVADEVIGFMQHDIVNKGIEVTVDSSISRPIVSDPNMLLVILRNLLSNAVKFTPEDGRIWLTFREFGGDILISVEDTGIGIAEEKREELFNIDRKKATGLGLILCFEFVKFLGGRIWTEKLPDKGAQFHFSLPKTAHVHNE